MYYFGRGSFVGTVSEKPLTEWVSHEKWVCRRHVPTLLLPAATEHCWIKNCPSVAPAKEQRPSAPPDSAEARVIPIVKAKTPKNYRVVSPDEEPEVAPITTESLQAAIAEAAVGEEKQAKAVLEPPKPAPKPQEPKPKSTPPKKTVKATPVSQLAPVVGPSPAQTAQPPEDAKRRGATASVPCSHCGDLIWRRPREIRESKTGKFFCAKTACMEAKNSTRYK